MPPKKKAKSQARPKPVATEVISNNADTVVNMNICRLCERENGPFLDLFDDGNVTVRKIEELMPFKVTNDEGLPKKICFRCSAKVEELYEFVKVCTRAQHNLLSALGKGQPCIKKTKTERTIWEEQLHKSNITNDVICDALVKKAMGFMTDFQLPIIELNKIDAPNTTNILKSSDATETKPNLNNKHEDNSIEPKKMQLKVAEDKKPKETKPVKEKDETKTDDTILIDDDVDTPLPEHLVDRVSIIKVNGFGILFQCKSCNRNFLKKSIISKHACPAGNNSETNKTVTETKPNEIPKPPNVKYINTADDKFVQAQNNPIASTSSQKKNLIGPASRTQASKLVTPVDTVQNDKKSRKRNAPETFPAHSQFQPMAMFGECLPIQQEQSFVANTNQPYPVGLFKSQLKDKTPKSDKQEHVIFSTTALNKQTYSVVKTTTPGKILISSKPQAVPQPSTSTDTNGTGSNHFSNVSNSATRDKSITFIPYMNDSQLQPSYVLPVDRTPEVTPQRGRSYGAQNYECQLCHEKFGREGKLVAHMNKHYCQFDDEIEIIEEKKKKKSKKSKK